MFTIFYQRAIHDATQRKTMPYSFRIDTDEKVVLFKTSGIFSSEELLGCLKEVVADPKFERGFNHFIDLREISVFKASASDIRMRVKLDREMEAMIGKCRIALVSSRDLVYGMSRMYEIMMDGTQAIVRSFKDAGHAAEWLGIPEDVTEWKKGA